MHLYRTFIAAAALSLTVVVGTSIGQQDRQDLRGDRQGAESDSARRLDSITWSPVDHKLTWTVSTGSMVDGKFEGNRKFTYEINMDSATMSFDGDKRRFSKQEAASVHKLMDLVAKYAAESTLWWEAGEGEPLDRDGGSRVDRRSTPHRSPWLIPERPAKRVPTDSKVVRISIEGTEFPVTVREIL